MNFSIKRVNAIFQKDFKDFTRNTGVAVSALMPLILAAFYGNMDTDSIEIKYLAINMTFVAVSTMVQCSLIAEEKEKNTLRGLMLSPASTLEILGGKSLLSLVFTILIIFISTFLLHYQPANIPAVAVAIILSSFFYIGIGTLLGLLAKSVMEATVLVLPVMAVFVFGSFLTIFIESYPILKVVEFFPNVQLIDLAIKVETGAGFVDVLSNLGIITAWVILIGALTTVVYQKRMMD